MVRSSQRQLSHPLERVIIFFSILETTEAQSFYTDSKENLNDFVFASLWTLWLNKERRLNAQIVLIQNIYRMDR